MKQFFLKNKKTIILAVILSVAVIFLIYLFRDSLKVTVKVPSVANVSFAVPKKNINIDYNALKSQAVKDLNKFEDIPPYSGETGRSNPFVQ